MNQLNFHQNNNEPIKAPPPQRNLPILQKLIEAYKVWQEYLLNFPKTSRYTLGEKIDSLFMEIIESLLVAAYSNTQKRKILSLQKSSSKLDLLKFFLRISWEIKALDNKKYIVLSKHFAEIGKMLGGWTRPLIK